VRFGVGAKLTISLMFVVLLGAISGGWSLYSLNSLRDRYEHLVQNVYPLQAAAQTLDTEVQIQAQSTIAYALTREPDNVKKIQESRSRAAAATQMLQQASGDSDDLLTHIQAVENVRSRFEKMVDATITGSDDLAPDQLVLRAESARRTGEELGKAVKALVEHLHQQVDAATTGAATAATQARVVLGVVVGLSLVLGLLISWLVVVFVGRPIRNVATQLARIAQGAGDLRQELRITSHDELGLLGQSFNQLVRGLAGTVRQVIEASQEVHAKASLLMQASQTAADAAVRVSAGAQSVAEGAQQQAGSAAGAKTVMNELSDAIGQIAGGAQQQAHQVQQTAATVAEVVQAMEGVARQAAEVQQASRLAASSAHRGAEIVDQTLSGMDHVRAKVLASAHKVQELGRYSGRIGDMLVVITDIAEQTNLLALNAAIEAARVGEHGRGFAVVAEEVRKLAARAGDSAKEMRNLVGSIQQGTQEAVAAITETTQDVEAGAALTGEAGGALREILGSVEQMVTAVDHISVAAQQVMASTRQMSMAVNDVAGITQENTAATEEMAAAAEQVLDAISSVHEISQRNGASLQSVSAFLFEVNNGIGGVAAAAADLAGIAGRLKGLVDQFKV
jgi:methyl-accepting chemotaxis protein